MQTESAIQKFRMMFTRDAESTDAPPELWQTTLINAVRELDRRTSEWERKGIARTYCTTKDCRPSIGQPCEDCKC